MKIILRYLRAENCFHRLPVLALILILFFSGHKVWGQVISYSGKNISLNEALEQIARDYNIRFAFDAGRFAEIKGDIDVRNQSFGEFLDYLKSNFSVNSKEIEGTYVLTIDEVSDLPLKKNKVETYKVSGYVADKKTGEMLRYCNIGWTSGRGTVTNDLGFFTFTADSPDSLLITASFLGYERLDTIIFPSRGKSLVLGLEPYSLMIPEITIIRNENRILQFTEESGRIAFDPSKTANVPGIDENDMMNTLNFVPGINFTGGISGGLSIRGGSPSENLILIDGIPVFEVNHIYGNMSILNGKYIHQVFVSRGGFDASFGERVSGLVEMNGRSGMKTGPMIDVSANMLNSNIMGVVPVSDKLSVSAAWRRSFVDWWQNYMFRKLLIDPVRNSPGESGTPDEVYPIVRYEDLNLKVSLHPSANHELNLNFLKGNDLQENDFYISSNQQLYRNEKADGNNLGASMNWSVQTGPSWHHYFNAGYSSYDRNSLNESGTYTEVDTGSTNNKKGKGKGLTKKENVKKDKFEIDDSRNDLEEFRVGYKAEYKTGIFLNQAGAGYTRDTFSYRFVSGSSSGNLPVDSVENQAKLDVFNFFVQQKIEVDPKLNFTWGLRGNYWDFSRKFYWQPRGSIEFRPAGYLKLQFSSGKYFQFLSRIKRFDPLGNIDLLWHLPLYEETGLLSSDHYILGVQFERKGLLVNLEGYHKSTSGKMNLFSDIYKKGNETRIRYVAREGEELSRGIDLFVNYRFHSWNHYLSYSFSRSEERYSGINGGEWFPAFDDVSHRLRINEIFSIKSWILSGSWTYGSGIPEVVPSDSWNNLEVKRLNYFSQLDFSAVKQLTFRTFIIRGGVSLLNVLNRRNILEINNLKFSTGDGSSNVRSDLSSVSFSPVFFINVKYH